MLNTLPSFIHEAYKIAEPMLAGREYFFDHFTAPDAHFFWCMRRSAQLGVDASSFPNCTAHFERIKTRAERAEAVRLGEIGERGIRQGGLKSKRFHKRSSHADCRQRCSVICHSANPP